MFDSTKGTILIAPALANSSCWANGKGWPSTFPAPGDILKAFIILALTSGIVVGNLVLICVLNNRRYIKYIDNQPRYLLTSLALNDLFIGILISPVALLPALYKCWPYGEIFCQIQALLRGALSQQSAVILVCMAIDRYLYLLHPEAYHRLSSKKGCALVISVTWILCVSVFAAMVLPGSGYYFNATGLMACDVFHSRIAFRILSCCTYYFPTTMALMYCYGSGFHISKSRVKYDQDSERSNGVPPACKNEHDTVANAPLSDEAPLGLTVNNEVLFDKVLSIQRLRLPPPVRPQSVSTSRTMAAMSLGFIVMVTPATIQEVVIACTGSKIPPALNFIITWLALSNSFWNPSLYWLLNSHFRRISKQLIQHYICCRRIKAYPSFDKPTSCCVSPLDSDMPHHKGQFDSLGEKYWGEILERAVSSSSLQAMQKSCNRAELMRCSGSFKGYSNSTCKHDLRYYDYGRPDCRSPPPFQIEGCARHGRFKTSDFCLFKPNLDIECGRSRSNLSLDESNFNKYSGRHPDL